MTTIRNLLFIVLAFAGVFLVVSLFNQKPEYAVHSTLVSVPIVSIAKEITKEPIPEMPINQDTKIIKASYLEIPSLKVGASIKAMGLTTDNKMAVPNNYVDVGWYKFGTRLGDPGNAVLGAHVDNGSDISGVFKNLKNITQGADIYVSDENGSQFHYKVIGRVVYDRNEKDTENVFGYTPKSQLKLITCYGTWLPGENTYDKRLVITAELIS